MRTDGKLNEECAVLGVILTVTEAARVTYNGLLSLQHRGQEGASIATIQDSKILYHKDIRLVNEVFTGEDLQKLTGCKAAYCITKEQDTLLGVTRAARFDNRRTFSI